jgi:drug/metabolite transporter (DMT)-like permease
MVVFGTIALFVSHVPLPSAEIALYRAIFALAVIGGFLLFKKSNPVAGVTRRDLVLLLLSGAAMGFNWIFLFEAYRYTTVSLATLSYYFAPVLVTLLCPFLFRERMSAKQIVCFVMSTLGVALIVGVSGVGGGNHLLGVALGLCAATLYATVILLNKYIKSVGGIHRTFLQFLAAVIVLTPYVALTGGFHLTSLTPAGWGFLLTLGILHSGIAYCLYFSSLSYLRGQEAALLSYIDPLVAVLLSVCILREAITPLQILGGVLILGFSLICEIDWKALRKSE